MSFTRSASAASLTAALFLSTALVMGGCSSKDEGPSAAQSTAAKALGLKGPSDKVFAQHFSTPKRSVSEAEGQQALALLNLDAPSGDALNWNDSKGADGNYSFTGLSIKDDDSTVSIKSAELVGVHMDGEVASFDRADFSGISILDEDEGVTVNMDALSIARPTPAMAVAILEALSKIKDVDDLDLDIDSDGEEMGFGALGMSGLSVTSKDVNLKAKSVVWGKNAETKLADFKLDAVNFSGEGKMGEAFTGSLGSIVATGLVSDNWNMLKRSPLYPMGVMGRKGYNPLAKAYDMMVLEDLNFDSDIVSVNTSGFEAKATEKGGVTTMRSVSDPVSIKFKEAPKSRDGKRMWDTVQSLGFDEFVFQSSQTSVLDTNTDTAELKDGYISLKDGFKLSYNYGASGVKAMTDALSDTTRSSNARPKLDAAIKQLKLNGFQLRLEDDSILERGINLAAQMRGGTPASVKNEMKMGLTLAPMMAGGGLEGEMITEMASAVGDFIQNGGTLSIVMDPKAPIALNDLANYKGSDMSLKDLGFSAKAE